MITLSCSQPISQYLLKVNPKKFNATFLRAPAIRTVSVELRKMWRMENIHHRLNMEVDLKSLFGRNVTWCAQLYSLAETPQLPPYPLIWTRITRAWLVSKDRRHHFVTAWYTLPMLGQVGANLPTAGKNRSVVRGMSYWRKGFHI